jgi:hypothetical protein
MRPEPYDQVEVAPFLGVVAAGVLTVTLQWTNGSYDPKAISVVAAVWILVLVAALGRLSVPNRWFGERGIVAALAVILAVQLGLLVTEPPTVQMIVRAPVQMHLFNFLLVMVALLVGIGLATPSRLRDGGAALPSGFLQMAWFPAIVMLHFFMGRLVIGFVVEPFIDVWTIEMESVRALLHGTNPYSITLSDPYGGTSPFFPPGVSVDGKLLFGFVYPPLCLLLCVPGYLLGGDTRWSTLVAIELAALLMAYARPGKISKLAAAAFLFMPRTFYVMDRAWTDSFVVFLTAAICFAAIRKPRWAFLCIGAYLCLKQHMFIAIPAMFMLIPRPIKWRETSILALKTAAVALIVTLPFVLWAPASFAHSVLNIREVFRFDSLSLITHLHNARMATLSKWTGLAAIVPVLAIGWFRAPRTAGGFALFAAATHFTLYFFSTHAFCNEYFNVAGALFCAVAAWGSYDGTPLVETRKVAECVAEPAPA